MAYPLSNPQGQYFNSSGSPLASGTIEFRSPTTDNLINTYPTADDADAQTNANSNPLTLNARGEAASGIYLEDGVQYKIILKDSAGSTIWTQDKVRSPSEHPPGDVRSYVLNADGATDDKTTLETIFNAHEHVFFREEKTYAIASSLTIPANVKIDFGGSTIRKTASDASESFQILVGTGAVIRNLVFEVPTGVTILRGINLAEGAQAHNVKVTSTDQQNNLGSSERAGFNVNGNNTVVDGLVVENFDKAIRIEDSNDGRWSNITVSSYATGITVHTCSRFALENYICHTKSANASTSAGHNGLLVEDSSFGKFSNIDVRDSGEHGIYHSVAVANSHFVGYSNVHISRSGQSGFKLSGDSLGRAKHTTIEGLAVVDCSTGNTAGATEHGLMIEEADYVTVTGYSYDTVNDADGAFNGIYIRNSTNVSIAAPRINDVADSGILITDEGAAETVNNIFITSPVIQDTGADGIEIDTDTTGSELRNIFIDDAYITGSGGYAVNVAATDLIILAPVRITGFALSPTSGMFNNATPVADPLLYVEMKDPQKHEVLTGTADASPHVPRSHMNSSSGAVTATLADGDVPFQRKVFTFAGSTSSTLSVTTHETSSPEVFTFAQSTDVLTLEWTGLKWATIYNNGVTV